MAIGTRDGKPSRASHLAVVIQRTSRCDTSLRTTPEALLQLVRDRRSIGGWHWITGTQLHADGHRYRGNGAGVSDGNPAHGSPQPAAVERV